ncbi:uncharacterized protein LOC128682227 isoform X2 [Plodia interpunctella]|uniref:uncharacterized protein LOC128682227 isoform X2 n=1 Tax=Plodia interpunctella TaxID=58824 RepID=UPI00236848B8|nr:uncharacterized protein LOC128682227 isoform X2 [Plodia interpunctella]
MSQLPSALVEIKIEPESADIPQQSPDEIEIKLEPVATPPVCLSVGPESIDVPPHEQAEVKSVPESVDVAPAVIKVFDDNVEIKSEEPYGFSQLSAVGSINIFDVKFEIDGPMGLTLDPEMKTHRDGVTEAPLEDQEAKIP